MFPKIKGLVAATFTPINKDGRLDLERIPEMVTFLTRNKIRYFYICGSTGEGASLSSVERMRLAESFFQYGREKIKIIVNVGHNNIQEAKELALHAQGIGAAAISATAPSYYSISSIEALVDSMAEIASGGPDLPFYYYHIPHLTGADYNMVRFLEIGTRAIPNLVGIKYTDSNLAEFLSCCEHENGQFDILFGRDEMMLSALVLGAGGFIGSTYNFSHFIYQQIMEGFANGDMQHAKNYQLLAVKIINIILKYGGLSAQKTIMKFLGVDCGSVRFPLINLKKEDVEKMRFELESLGFFNTIPSFPN